MQFKSKHPHPKGNFSLLISWQQIQQLASTTNTYPYDRACTVWLKEVLKLKPEEH